jgi:hypothetical protein
MEGIPQGLKPLFSFPLERPKAEALGYLEAAATARASARQKANSKQQIPFGDDKKERQRQQQMQQQMQKQIPTG